MTTNGIRGVIGQRNRPALSVLTEPRWPTIVISAPAIGVPLRASTRRPSIGVAGPNSTIETTVTIAVSADIAR